MNKILKYIELYKKVLDKKLEKEKDKSSELHELCKQYTSQEEACEEIKQLLEEQEEKWQSCSLLKQGNINIQNMKLFTVVVNGLLIILGGLVIGILPINVIATIILEALLIGVDIFGLVSVLKSKNFLLNYNNEQLSKLNEEEINKLISEYKSLLREKEAEKELTHSQIEALTQEKKSLESEVLNLMEDYNVLLEHYNMAQTLCRPVLGEQEVVLKDIIDVYYNNNEETIKKELKYNPSDLEKDV